jgi:hypothetical protein
MNQKEKSKDENSLGKSSAQRASVSAAQRWNERAEQ